MPATSRLETADEFWPRYQRFATEQEARDPQNVANQRLYFDRLWKGWQVASAGAPYLAVGTAPCESSCTAPVLE
jgi:hypothetical protein